MPVEIAELQVKAVIAAALIGNNQIDLRGVPADGAWTENESLIRLQRLTQKIFDALNAKR